MCKAEKKTTLTILVSCSLMAGLLIVLIFMATKGGNTVNESKIIQTGNNEAQVENDNVHALVNNIFNLHMDKMESKFMWMGVS